MCHDTVQRCPVKIVKDTGRQFDIELCAITLCCNGDFFRAKNKEQTVSHRKLTFMPLYGVLFAPMKEKYRARI